MTDTKEEVPVSPDVHFDPVIQLPEVDVKTLEEDEEELLKLRARLYRFVSNPSEWKERGTGFVKLLKNKAGNVRLLMRRDKTLKICANHCLAPWMDLQAKCGSDKAWVWSVAADFADEVPSEEMLAIRFASVEDARKFKTMFDECKELSVPAQDEEDGDDASDSEDLTKEVEKLTVKSDSEDKKPAEAAKTADDEDSTHQEKKEAVVKESTSDATVDRSKD